MFKPTKEFTKQIENDMKVRDETFKEAQKIAKLFKGKSVQTSLDILDNVAYIIKKESTF